MAGRSASIWSLVDLNGTASRKRGWLVLGVFLGTAFLAQYAAMRGLQWGSASLLAVGLTFILWIVVLVQRLHEIGRSGYWSLLGLLPGLGIVFCLIVLCLPPRPVGRRGHPVARRIGGAGLLALAALYVSRAVYWQPYWIPSENMKPTLLVGDFILATRISPDAVQRGDVVVFRHPVNGTDFVKRVVGLPGDRVQMIAGILHLNGTAVPQTPDGTFVEVFAPQGPMQLLPRCENGPVAAGEPCTKSRLIERFPDGRQHGILDIDTNGMGDNTDVFTVPPGAYFVMGDNRDNSNDSRFSQMAGGVGFVPAENIRLLARRVLFSSAGGWIADVTSWRPDRYLRAIE